MRTTLTLDDDVLDEARRLADRLGMTFRRLVNEAIRKGLPEVAKPPKKRRFRTKPHHTGGIRPGYSIDNIGELLAQLEEEESR